MRFMTSVSWGSKAQTRPSATEVIMLTHRICGVVIGIVKPMKIATMITRPCATLVGSRNRIAFSMLL